MVSIKPFFLIFIFLGATAMDVQSSDQVIFSFTGQAEFEQWRVINDGVMGGISQSSFKAGDGGAALFAGTVSLENYGGFCSVSTIPDRRYDLSGFDAVVLRVRGDGKRYKCTLKADAAFSGFAYQFGFSTKKGEWISVVAPFQDFVPTFRGQVVRDAGKIDSSSIASFGFLISDKQQGRFVLEIDSITATAMKKQEK